MERAVRTLDSKRRASSTLAAWAAVMALLAVSMTSSACSKKDDEAQKEAPATNAPPAQEAPLATNAPSPSSPPTPGAVPAASAPTASAAAPTPAKPPAPTASASPTATTANPADAAPACGKKPLPDCPLQGWMKKNTSPAMAADDMPAVAAAFEKIVAFAPPGYTNWASISRDGAAAAKAGNTDAVKGACRGCHDQYRTKYRTELRARPLP